MEYLRLLPRIMHSNFFLLRIDVYTCFISILLYSNFLSMKNILSHHGIRVEILGPIQFLWNSKKREKTDQRV